MTTAEQLAIDPAPEVQYFPVGRAEVPFMEVATPVDGEPPYVLLHGLNKEVTEWGKYPELLGRYTVAVGLPEGCSHFEPPTLKAYARPLAEAIHGIVGDRYDLGGYSFGGLLAQRLAINDRKHIRRLVLMATMPLTPFAMCAVGDPQAMRALMSPRRDLKSIARIYGGDVLEDPDLLEGLEATHPINIERHTRQIMAAYLTRGLIARRMLQRDKPDTLVVAGNKDPLMPYWAVKAGAVALGAKLATAKGDGHGMLVTRTGWLAKVTREHLERPE